MRFEVLGLLSLFGFAVGTASEGLAPRAADFKAALIRAPPALWEYPILSRNYSGVDINKTTDKGVRLIDRAAEEGATLVAFPELWFPGYPRGNGPGDWIKTWGRNYAENSITLGDDNWLKIVDAAKRNAVYLSVAISKRVGDAIYMSQILLDPQGEILIHRHKLRPSGSERYIWSDGLYDGFKVVDTPYGRIGMLECWEYAILPEKIVALKTQLTVHRHFHPAMTFPTIVQQEAIHIGAWPYMPDSGEPGVLNWESVEVNMAAASVYATNSGAYNLVPVVGRAAAFAPTGLEIASISADASFCSHPYLMVELNTTGFADRPKSRVDGEISFSALKEMWEGWPADVPKAQGTFTDKVKNVVTGW